MARKRSLKHMHHTVQELFEELDIDSFKRLLCIPQLDSKVKDNLKVVWKPAKQVQIVKENEKRTVWTTAITVKNF